MRKRWSRSTALGDALFVPMLMADLAGQLMVYTYEAGVTDEPAQMTFLLAAGDGQPPGSFLEQGWEEALAEFRRRGLISEDELSTLLRENAERSVEARRALLDHVQARVYELLEHAIDTGGTFRGFAKQLREDADGLGISANDTAYLQTVFRTNVMDAYGRGRHAALQDPDVVAARPYRQIRTAGDTRVRSEHDDLDGKVYMANGPLKELKTPFGYNCRCSIVSLAEWDGEVIDSLPPDAVTPGFG